jgi:hypothetical protein
MMKRQLYVMGLLLFLLLVSLSFTPAEAIVHRYVEDFSTTQYKDTSNTTAWWDTVAGEIKLHPFELTLAGSYDTPGYALGVAISGDYAYVADEASGLQVIDITDPTTPTLVGSYDTPVYACGVAISGDYAYVGDYTSGLQVIQVFQRHVNTADNVGQSLVFVQPSSDVDSIRLSTIQTDSISWEISADSGAHWQVVIPDTTSWTKLSYPGKNLLWRSTHFYTEPKVNPTCTYLEIEWGGENGVSQEGQSELPISYSLSQNYPNPFNPMTEIKYALPAISGQQTAVRLAVYNNLGEKVATLVDETQSPGYKAVTWNAKDVGSGVYFYRLEAGSFVQTRKMVLLK